MKVCLIYPLWQNSFYEIEISCHWPPVGVAYIASLLRKKGHEVTLIDRRNLIGNVRNTKENLDKLNKITLNKLKEYAPDIIGITATTPLITDTYICSRISKEYNKDVPVIVGGCHPSAEPKKTLEECCYIDIVCIGEGEFTFCDIVSGKLKEEIDGIAYRKDNIIVINKKRIYHQNIDELPFPARGIFDKKRYFCEDSYLVRGYLLKGTTILAARGCPYKCSFCQSGQLSLLGEGPYVRFHSPEYVIEQIKQLVMDYGINGLLFAEDLFSIRKENVFNICNLMIKENIDKKIKWAANLRVDRANKELLDIMKKAGCIQVVYGCESGSQKILDRLNKKTTVEQNYNAIKSAKEAGLDVEVNMMIGLPDEKEEDLLATIKFLKKAKPNRVNRAKLYPLPGTPFYKEFIESGKISNLKSWDELWDIYYETDFTFSNITPRKFLKLRAKMDREVTYPINYSYHIINNLKSSVFLSIKYTLLFIGVCMVLYLPMNLQIIMRKLAKKLKIQYIFTS